MPTRTAVFIPGPFLSVRSFDPWIGRFAEKGYECVDEPYPLQDKSVMQLRREHPNPAIGSLAFNSIADHYMKIIGSQPKRVVLIGESLGGTMVELFLSRGLGSAGIAIDPLPPKRTVILRPSYLRSNWPILDPINRSDTPFLYSITKFQYAFANGMPLKEQLDLYDRLAIPGSLRAVREAKKLHIDRKKGHPPLLIMAEGKDRLCPTPVVGRNFGKYLFSAPSLTEYQVFPGMNHLGFASEGWLGMADYALEWLDRIVP